MPRLHFEENRLVLLPMMMRAGWGGKSATEVITLAREVVDMVEQLTPGLQSSTFNTIKCSPYHSSLLAWMPGVDVMPGNKQYLRIKLPSGDSSGIVREYGHRLICWAYHGPPPEDKTVVRHTCGNHKGKCLNPAHLEWSSVAVNSGDAVRLRRRREAHRKQLQQMIINEGGRSPSI